MMRFRLKSNFPPSSLGSFLAVVAFSAGCHKANSDVPALRAVAPRAVPKTVDDADLPKVKFVEVGRTAGIAFRHVNSAFGEKLLPETMGSGAAFFDYDNDGDMDLFLVNSNYWPDKRRSEPSPSSALYRNEGDGRFVDVTKEAGLETDRYGFGVAVGDYDNDGDADLYLTALGGGALYRNDSGRFVDVTRQARAKGADNWPTSAAFLDIDNDGDLDLFICQYVNWSPEYDRAQDFQLTGTGKGRAYGRPTDFLGSFCVLLRNDDGVFADISASSGIQVKSPSGDPDGKALGVAPFDYDMDGKVDIAVSNDTVPNYLFHNLGGGKFEEVGVTMGVALDNHGTARAGMGIDWAHFRSDETLGLAVANFANEMIALYVSDRPRVSPFADLANINGLGAPTQPPLKFSLFFFDYDLDGRLDLLSVNGHLESDIAKVQATQTYAQPAQLYWNTGKRGRSQFVLVGPEVAGPDLFQPIVGRGSSYADIDGDGDLDVVLTANGGPAHLLRNDGGSKNHWLRIRLVGRGKSNRDALGAKVDLVADGLTLRRQHFLSKGYLSSVEPILTFGLGKREKADSIAIVWPSGEKSEFRDVPADRLVEIDEEKGIVSSRAKK